jgi:hypothetical protein
VDAFGVDFSDAHGLWTLLNSVRQLDEAIDDTEMTAGSEAYQTALVFYHSAKMAAAQYVPDAKAVYEELKTRFPQRGGRRGTGAPRGNHLKPAGPQGEPPGFKAPPVLFGAEPVL